METKIFLWLCCVCFCVVGVVEGKPAHVLLAREEESSGEEATAVSGTGDDQNPNPEFTNAQQGAPGDRVQVEKPEEHLGSANGEEPVQQSPNEGGINPEDMNEQGKENEGEDEEGEEDEDEDEEDEDEEDEDEEGQNDGEWLGDDFDENEFPVGRPWEGDQEDEDDGNWVFGNEVWQNQLSEEPPIKDEQTPATEEQSKIEGEPLQPQQEEPNPEGEKESQEPLEAEGKKK